RGRGEVPADLITDALERVRALDRVHVEQLLVADRVRPLHVAGDVEPPRRGVDGRLDERGVDDVVVLGPGDPRRYARDRLDCGVGGGRRLAGTQVTDGERDRLGVSSRGADRTTEHAGRDRDDPGAHHGPEQGATP